METIRSTDDSTAKPTRWHDIATVAQITGLTAANIRAWEKRYQTIVPRRTETGRRLYTDDDLEKLKLLKKLSDLGIPIRSTASLSVEELEAKISELNASTSGRSVPAAPIPFPATPRVMAIGAHALRRVKRVSELGLAFRLVEIERVALDPDSFHTGADLTDILVVEAPALFEETIADLYRLQQRFGGNQILVLYRYSQSATLERIQRDESNIVAVQEPITDQDLRNALARLVLLSTRDRVDSEIAQVPLAGSRPRGIERRFDEADLDKIGMLNSTVDCECPRHIANLLKGLNAFEAYSAACESRNPADAQMHHFLYQTTIKARVAMEEAMERLMRFEGIDLDEI